MFAKAEADVNALVAELGADAPMTMPDTAYFLACIYAYLGKKVTTVGELQAALADVKAMMLREPRTHSIFSSGVGTAIAAEMIEACKYARTPTPYEGTAYHGHFTDAEVRELGVPLVTRDIPGFVVMIGLPLRRRGGGDHQGLSEPRYLCLPHRRHHRAGCPHGRLHGLPGPCGPRGRGHLVRWPRHLPGGARLLHLRRHRAGDYDAFMDYSMDRIFAFVNAYAR